MTSLTEPTEPPQPAEPIPGGLVAVESSGTEPIALGDRHGKPRNLLWTWASPNMEFATVFVGVIGVLFCGLSFPMAVLAIVTGNLLASVFHAVLTSFGPATGLPQMVLSRRAFGFLGNILPAGLNAVLTGIGWFAVNSVSGSLALSALTGLSVYLCLLLGAAATVAFAVLGHNFVHLFQRVSFPLLVACFAIGMVFVFIHADPGAASEPVPGGFWIAMSATFGYTAAWNPLAADYSRYLPASTERSSGVFAGIGLFVSTTALQIAGAAAVTAVGVAAWNYDNPTESYTSVMPAWLANVTLLGIFAGAMAANAINLYSASLSFASLGLSLPSRSGRAGAAIAMAAIGLVVAWIGADSIDSFEGLLLVIAYWIGPWLGVVLVDRALYWHQFDQTIYTNRTFANPAGPIAMAISVVVSIWLFSNQTFYVGVVPTRFPEVGDITFIVGFFLSAILYLVIRRLVPPRAKQPDVVHKHTTEIAVGPTPTN